MLKLFSGYVKQIIKPVTHHFHQLEGGCSSLLELLSYHPNTCIIPYERTDSI